MTPCFEVTLSSNPIGICNHQKLSWIEQGKDCMPQSLYAGDSQKLKARYCVYSSDHVITSHIPQVLVHQSIWAIQEEQLRWILLRKLWSELLLLEWIAILSSTWEERSQNNNHKSWTWKSEQHNVGYLTTPHDLLSFSPIWFHGKVSSIHGSLFLALSTKSSSWHVCGVKIDIEVSNLW